MWSHAGIVCTGETYKNVVKVTFAKGASLEDPSGLFNSSLEGNTRRAIDFHAGEAIDGDAFKASIRAAVSLNESSGRAPREKRNSAQEHQSPFFRGALRDRSSSRLTIPAWVPDRAGRHRYEHARGNCLPP